MIEIPMWIFIVLLVGFSFFAFLMIFGIIQVIHDKLIDYAKWKTNYNKYKEFWDENKDLR